MKMKIIDLLNKIANGEEVPKKIKVNNMFVYEYDNGIDYRTKDGTYLFNSYIQITNKDMNMEVKIIEEEKKIPEKFKVNWEIDDDNTIDLQEAGNVECMLADKINEIIDYLKSKEE